MIMVPSMKDKKIYRRNSFSKSPGNQLYIIIVKQSGFSGGYIINLPLNLFRKEGRHTGIAA